MSEYQGVLVTGATGFIGSRLVNILQGQPKREVTGVVRRTSVHSVEPQVIVKSIDADTDWSSALGHQEVVIHVAARAHVTRDRSTDPLREYRKVNVNGTLNLARQAAAAGVRRFIFISSIGVNGNISSLPFTERDKPNPSEPYARSKWEAEQGLWHLQHKTGMEIVIIRPPLVYGPNAPGNFGSLVRWTRKALPLPLGCTRNKRSLVALDNLVDFIVICIDHPAAANQLFLAGDGQDLSTTELLKGVAKAMGRPSRLVPVPPVLLIWGAKLFGKGIAARRLLGSLQVDISKARQLLGWEPPLSVEEGLRRCFVLEDKL